MRMVPTPRAGRAFGLCLASLLCGAISLGAAGAETPPAAGPGPAPAVRPAAFHPPVASGAGSAARRDWTCLATALYFEARGESESGQIAVAEVILNRVDADEFPDTVCAVVHQGGRGGCQFSFTCDGRPDTIRERAAYEAAGRVAQRMLDGAPRVLTGGATHFHTRAVRPRWARTFARTAAIGHHLFYRAGADI